jgi:NAD(P)-dependent dehydrogenase (short-subunit alcohol dehydrogenase family)
MSAPSADTAVPRALEGRRALVTGSSRNLGAEIARSLAARGATVVVTYHRSRDEAEAVVEALRRATSLPHRAVPADLSEPDAAGGMVEAAQDALGGPVEILVNNHGPFSMTPFHRMPADEFAHVMDGNLTLTLRAVQQVVPGMRSGGWGRIVNLSAGSAYLRNHSVYGLAKSAIVTLTESLALELGPEITVNAVAPGQIIESTADIGDIDPTFVDRAVARTPAGRLVTRHEIAEIVAALCAPPFDLLTGAVLPVDGGWRFNRF